MVAKRNGTVIVNGDSYWRIDDLDAKVVGYSFLEHPFMLISARVASEVVDAMLDTFNNLQPTPRRERD